jgi:hypothetical protein
MIRFSNYNSISWVFVIVGIVTLFIISVLAKRKIYKVFFLALGILLMGLIMLIYPLFVK